MTNDMDTINFEEMRNQIAILKNKLDAQEIVNDRLLRETMQIKVNTLNALERKTLVCGIVAMVMYVPMHYLSGFSWPFCIATGVIMLFSIVSTIYIYYPINKTDLMSGDMTTVAQVMARFRRQNSFWVRYVTPTLIIPWVSWAAYDYTQAQDIDLFSPLGLGLVLPLLIGAVIGFIIGFSWHRKAQRTALDIIRQLSEN